MAQDSLAARGIADLPGAPDGADNLVTALLRASEALEAITARSLVGVGEDVTLVQYRVLVELAARGPQRLVDLAEVLGVQPSSANRMCERLLRKGLVGRRRAYSDRRTVRIFLAPDGKAIVGEVSQRRRTELAAILARLPEHQRGSVVAALDAFAAAANAPELLGDEWPGGGNPRRPEQPGAP